ncbi:MAG: sugar phosphate isomerase/epimerase [Chloroflexota bacterium]
MVLFGAHTFIWAAEWTPETAEHVIESAARAGLDFVEIPLLRPNEMDVAGTRRLLDQFGLQCTCSLGLPRDAHLPFAPDRALAFLEQAVEVAARLESPVLTGCLYTHLGTLTRLPPTHEEITTVVRVLKQVARFARDREVSLGIEPVNRYETYLLNLAEQAVEIVDRVDEPNLFVHLDTYHMNIEEKGFYDPIVATGRNLQYIHLSESDRGIPGTGNVHWNDVFRGLRAVRYEGRLVMESFAAVNEDIIGATALWRDVVGDPDRLVTEGLAFLRDKAVEHGVMGA